MIIKYATKEIRDCVLHDLWVEVSAGCFADKISELQKNFTGITIYFGALKLRVSDWKEKELEVECRSDYTFEDLEKLFTICKIINFLKAGEKK